ERPDVIPRMTWHDAMDRFGVDKPDLRFGMELVELTDIFAATAFKAFAGAAAIKAIRHEGASSATSRNQLDALTDRAKTICAKGRVWRRVGEDATLDSPIAKFLSDDEKAAIVAATGAQPGDVVYIVA